MLKYNNTSEIQPSDDILSQKRVKKAIELGLKVEDPTYNIYVAGESGLGKSRYVKKMIDKQPNLIKKHMDWCYLYNFENPREPMIAKFKPGKGKEFKEDVEELLNNILEELSSIYDSEGFELGKAELLEEYEEKRDKLLNDIKEYGAKLGFNMKLSQGGVVFVPSDEDAERRKEILNDQEFEIRKKELEKMSIKVVYQLKDIEIEAEKAVSDLEKQIAELIIDPLVDALKKKYDACSIVIKYFNKYKEEILKDLDVIYVEADSKQPKLDKDYFKRFSVNLFIDNSRFNYEDKVPVVFELNPTPNNLFGRAEYDYSNGNIKTDFTKLLPGSIHEANGGYLVLYSDQLFRYPTSWDMLKRALRTHNIDLETQTSIKPQAMPMDIKIILIGNKGFYNSLYNVEQDFRNHFKVLVDFENSVEKNEKNEELIAGYIALKCNENNLNHLEHDAVTEVIKQCVRAAGDSDKISTRLDKIDEILIEANTISKYSNRRKDNHKDKYINKEDVIEAIQNKKDRIAKIEERMDESVLNEFTLIETSGSRVGVINALSVLSTGEYSFGRPSRISVTTSPGTRGIVNIEREVDMSGSIHSKGVFILGGYLSENFAQDILLSLNAYICFEQNYGGVDGDSASLAELCTLLSSLGDIPIKQSIAITGSINQKGDIQVIGGVSEKVEGFYRVCKLKGLSEEPGVIIPKNNYKNLVLSDELNKAIEEGKFKIYTVEKVDEAFTILTGMEFDEAKKEIKKKLNAYSNVRNLQKESK